MLAISYGVYRVITLGDLFDHRFGGPPPEVVLTAMEELEYAQSRNVVWEILLGNHDIHSKADMSLSLTRTFSRLAVVVNEPKVVKLPGGGALFYAPWRPFSELKRDLLGLSKEAVKIRGPKTLLCHTPLKEGSASASNFQSRDLDIAVRDMVPEVYDMVLLGDYHGTQKVGKNVWYLGSPIRHTHGDGPPGGMYLLDSTRAQPVLHRLELPSTYPDYCTYDLTYARGEDDLVLPGYNPDNYNRVRVPLELEAKAKKIWPSAAVRGVATVLTVKKLGRLGKADPNNKVEVMAEFCAIKGWGDEAHQRVGLELLRKAEGLE